MAWPAVSLAQFNQGFGMPQQSGGASQPDAPLVPGQDSAGMHPGVDTSAFITRSPNGTLEGTKRFLGLVGLQVQLLLQYTPVDLVGGKLPAGVDVVASSSFTKNSKGATRTIQLLAITREGGYDLYVLGEETLAEDRHPNPDLATLLNEVRSLEDTERLRGRGSLEHHIYQLSYIQADRAIAGLKALGYSTIEYQASDGEDTYSHVYKPIENGEKGRLPVVIRLIDSSKTSLMDSAPLPSNKAAGGGFGGMPQTGGFGGGGGSVAGSAVPDIGGTYLHQVTAAEPQQRLLIVYDKSDGNSLARLLNLLHEKLDTPARQVLIEAQVIEINTDKLKQLGINFTSSDGRVGVGIQPDAAGNSSALSLNLATATRQVTRQYSLQLQALVQSGDADVLSNPSVLVLDGRQARIQIGKQVPVVKSTTTVAGTTSSVDYFPVGIVLNLRPRTSEDGQQVSMQVETIVSDINASGSNTGQATNVVVAPVIDNRQVQTFVRVGDNTPFIIGGLVSTTQQLQRSGVPFLSEIPVIGALFGTTSYQDVRKEVIVVITPHVVPLEESTFSYVTPKDSQVFSSFGDQLFRNAYRVRSSDVFDLKFVAESDAAGNLRQRVRAAVQKSPALGAREPYTSILKGNIPGEDIFIRRMIFEIIQKTHYGDHIDMDRIIYFKDGVDLNDAVAYKPERLNASLANLGAGNNTLIMSFDSKRALTPEHPFLQSRAAESAASVKPERWYERLQECYRSNPDGTDGSWCIPVGDYAIGQYKVQDVLRAALMMKRVLSLNESMPLTIKDFKAGRQLVFPSENELTQGYWVIDQDVARYFDEAILYYPAFERSFLRQSTRIISDLEEKSAPILPPLPPVPPSLPPVPPSLPPAGAPGAP